MNKNQDLFRNIEYYKIKMGKSTHKSTKNGKTSWIYDFKKALIIVH